MKRETHTIDATDQRLGRLATRIATLLRGKHKPHFIYRDDCGDFVIVQNLSKAHFDSKKLDQKIYYRHTGYLGGLKKKTMREILENDPAKLLSMIVRGMIPPTRLRKEQLKRLKVIK